jgi:hypothetical protein
MTLVEWVETKGLIIYQNPKTGKWDVMVDELPEEEFLVSGFESAYEAAKACVMIFMTETTAMED